MAVDQEHTIWALYLELWSIEADILWSYLNRQATTFIKGISVSQPLLRVVIQQLGSRVLEMHQGTALRWRAAAVWRGGKESYRGKSSPPHLATISSLQRARDEGRRSLG
ncbi:predicted acyl esterase [Aspergillus luchuensis]|uniref:Predicted acyl esterase n=1 Tax=Aspergillus kawachii TaxID=1069201 RepID=A0A146FS13_ASPKA|nr:predicted acyl esterase [Aspergillus luchuensis]